MKQTNSSVRDVSLASKLRYYGRLAHSRFIMPAGAEAVAAEIADLRGIAAQFEERTGLKASESTVLEIGFGARPRRAFLLTGIFRQVYAIDIDHPVLRLRDILSAWRRNGWERSVKSLVRHCLFETREWPRFHAAARAELPAYDPASAHLLVASVGDPSVWDKIGSVDLAFSRDVFEHIPVEELRLGMLHLREHLSAHGMVITQPGIFTGIIGGHDPNWTVYRAPFNPPEQAWQHLTDPAFSVNTYLNRLTRREFVKLFEDTGFRIERDHALMGDIHAHLLTPQKRAELAAFDEYELFSNRVEFHLLPR
ncbi:class I SAM-dependent methyltransferase [Erythrobacter sp. SDW2]|uniref:class I SAM-dependent methyltransferase n=1 Tax=Erythrobacter sp. SDW2 TaxID=2907154 RepID=UPI001F1D0D79|nr:class I SAM-dependent methyltransferase [Erythrobacter sp. SDW2]UIP07678.1 class I SAM-dependent methyltransferase [Erythrobacter sp. SDW2]